MLMFSHTLLPPGETHIKIIKIFSHICNFIIWKYLHNPFHIKLHLLVHCASERVFCWLLSFQLLFLLGNTMRQAGSFSLSWVFWTFWSPSRFSSGWKNPLSRCVQSWEASLWACVLRMLTRVLWTHLLHAGELCHLTPLSRDWALPSWA